MNEHFNYTNFAKSIMKLNSVSKHQLTAKGKILYFWLIGKPVTNFLKDVYLSYPSDTLKHLTDDNGIQWHKKKADGANWCYFIPNSTPENWQNIKNLFEIEVSKSIKNQAA